MLVGDRYKLGQRIGVGGMGTVYLGHDSQDDSPVAIKQLKPEVVQNDPTQVERFIREGEALRQLNHPNIVKLLAAVQQDDAYFLVMEYIDGGSLLDVLAAQPRLSVQRTLYIALDLADALTRAHRLNILHRDIKPGNVLLDSDGVPRLSDFGMARLDDSEVTQEGAIVGTLAYLSPEALRSEALDERHDIWAFGVMLYEMLAGQRPFNGTNAGTLVSDILTQPITPLDALRPDLPTALVDLVQRMLARERDARVPTVRRVGAELEGIIRGDTSSMQVLVADTDGGRFNTSAVRAPGSSTSTRLPRSNLPTQPTPFIGRESELAALESLLAGQDARLITLLGPGGIGKSRLALEAAARLLPQFPDGVFFVPLAPLDDPALIARAIADAVDYDFVGAESPERQIVNHLKDKTALLLVDNVEHVIDGAGLMAEILQHAPGVCLIATSRERLRLRGEYTFEVNALSVPGPDEPVEALATYHAVQLFLGSAARVLPDFELTQDTAPYVCQVIDRVQGLPLGIELAAAWLEALPVDEIVAEIDRSLDFLETDLRDVPERHRSLRAVFDYSWQLLTDDEQGAFMHLSIFRGGFEREAAQAVTGASLRTLTTLTNKSLLRRDPNGRYFLHALLREYAEGQFNAYCQRKKEIESSHARYYAEMLLRLRDVLNTRREAEALEIIERENDNLRAAWRLGLAHGMWDDLVGVLHTLAMYYLGRSLLREGRDMFSGLIDALEANGQQQTNIYWQAQTYRAMMLRYLGDFDAAWQAVSQAAAFFEAHDQPECLGYALNTQSDIRLRQGRYDDAIHYAVQAVTLYERTQTLPIWFTGMMNLAVAEYERGSLPEARHMVRQLIERCEADDCSPIFHASALSRLGQIEGTLGEFETALALYEQAYDIYERYKQKRGMAITLSEMAGMMFSRGRSTEARRSYERAHQLYQEIGDRVGLGHSLAAMGNLRAYFGDTDGAMPYYAQSLVLRRELGDRRGVADSLRDMLRIHMMRDDLDAAGTVNAEAMAVYREIGDLEGEGYCHNNQGLIEIRRGDYDAADASFRRALDLAERTGSQFINVQTLGGMGVAAVRQGRYEEAAPIFLEGLRLAQRVRAHPAVRGMLMGLAPIYAARGQAERALTWLELSQQAQGTYLFELTGHEQAMRDAVLAYLPDPAAQERARKAAAGLELFQVADEVLAEAEAAT